jgi:hypothetical protein
VELVNRYHYGIHYTIDYTIAYTIDYANDYTSDYTIVSNESSTRQPHASHPWFSIESWMGDAGRATVTSCSIVSKNDEGYSPLRAP